MSDDFLHPQPLGSLLRKAAVDAGFDLEPELDGGWWRLRSSGVGGVVWVRTAPSALLSAPIQGQSLLALPLSSQLAELQLPTVGAAGLEDGAIALPPGASGAVLCPGPIVLYQALRRVWSSRNNASPRMQDRWNSEVESALAAARAVAPGSLEPSSISAKSRLVTEALAHVRRRIGQDIYREALIDYWGGQCAVTGLAVPELLRASHAKPWAVATDAERMDVHNGFLLAVHLDALFDKGFMTFDERGYGILSTALSPMAAALLGVDQAPLCLRWVSEEHAPFLEYHRTHVFRGNDPHTTC